MAKQRRSSKKPAPTREQPDQRLVDDLDTQTVVNANVEPIDPAQRQRARDRATEDPPTRGSDLPRRR
jgi:hypothetical protein